jgi:hypothetical protein
MVLGFLLVLPLFVITEGIYLLRHPRTFNGVAVCVWAGVSGIGFLVGLKEQSLPAWAIGQIIAVVVYYWIKVSK